MSNLEPNELPKRPDKVKVYGKHANTILMMENQKSHQIHIEYIGNKVYELQIFTYSKGVDDKECERTEYILHINKLMLRYLEGLIKQTLG